MPVLLKSDDGFAFPRRDLSSATTYSPSHIAARATGCSGNYLSSGAIAGIVIGTIAGTLLVLWIIKSCFALGPPTAGLNDTPVVAKRHSSNHGHSQRHRHRSRSRSQPRAVYVKEQMAQPQRAYYGYPDYDQRGRR